MANHCGDGPESVIDWRKTHASMNWFHLDRRSDVQSGVQSSNDCRLTNCNVIIIKLYLVQQNELSELVINFYDKMPIVRLTFYIFKREIQQLQIDLA